MSLTLQFYFSAEVWFEEKSVYQILPDKNSIYFFRKYHAASFLRRFVLKENQVTKFYLIKEASISLKNILLQVSIDKCLNSDYHIFA
ncbi:MAG: hypothetical protein ACRYGB_09735 [Janthinobacterium lividum]